MEWSSSNTIPFIPQSSFAFLYNYNTHDPYPYPPGGGAEMKHEMMQQQASMDINCQQQIDHYDSNNMNNNQDKKKRLTSEQLEALENSFQEEIKLDPDRKTKLAYELGLQPRQVAVWFQNRRARWKGKQLERLYDALKQEFDLVFREKQKLQHEVQELRTILKEHGTKRQVAVSTTGYSDMSGGEETTLESASMNNQLYHATRVSSVAAGDSSNYMLNYDEEAAIPTPKYYNRAVLPSYP